MKDQFADDPHLKKLLQSFVRGLPEKGSEIKQAAQNAEWAKVTHLAHKLKGTAACYGVPLVSQCAAKLERLTAENAADPKILLLIEDLQTLVLSLAPGLLKGEVWNQDRNLPPKK